MLLSFFLLRNPSTLLLSHATFLFCTNLLQDIVHCGVGFFEVGGEQLRGRSVMLLEEAQELRAILAEIITNNTYLVLSILAVRDIAPLGQTLLYQL